MAEYIDRAAAVKVILRERKPTNSVAQNRMLSIIQAYSNGIVEGLNRGIDLMLYVLIDKHDAPMDDVQQLAGELNHAAQCVAEGYVTWADIRQMLKEYGVETALE